MTISEANAVNVLLTYLLGKRRGYVLNDPSKDDVREAAELLAAKAYRALSAGWTPETATAAWEARRPKRRRDP